MRPSTSEREATGGSAILFPDSDKLDRISSEEQKGRWIKIGVKVFLHE